MARRLLIAAATLTALMSVAACDGSVAGSESGSESGGAGTTTRGRETGSGGGSSGEEGQEEEQQGEGEGEGFSYLPWGPDDPPIPTQYAVLAASGSTAPRCDDLADARPDGGFWETALAVCRALTEGGDWPDTTTVPAAPPAVNAYQSCLDDELAAMLERALRWHADHPGQQPQVAYPSDASTSPCQAHIYEVRVLTEADLEPGEGHPEGVGLAITGSAMDQDPSVTVDGQLAELTEDFNVDQPEGDGLTTVVVLALADEQPRTATIEVSTYRGPLVATVDLPGRGSSTPPDPAPSDGTDKTDSPAAPSDSETTP